MTNKKKQEEREKAEQFVRKALAAVSKKPVSEAKVKAVAKKVSLAMLEVLEAA